jgi:hypothetical protein
MALENLISISFTPEDLKKMDEALNTLQTLLQGKTINLTPAQRMLYGAIAEQNKLFVSKAKGYMEQYPEYVPRFVDKTEFDADYAARQQLEERFQRLSSLSEQLSDTKVLLDHDNYHNALTFYRNIRYLSGENMPGTTVIYNDMKQFFKSGSSKHSAPATNESDPTAGK